MKNILFLGTSFGSCELVEDAKKRGLHTIVTDYNPPERSAAKRIADETWDVSTGDTDLLERLCRERKIDAVFAGVSEFNLDQVLKLTDRLGLPCYISPGAWKTARNKRLTKKALVRAGVPVPADFHFLGDSEKEMRGFLRTFPYPVVVKPVDQCGGDGVSFCDSPEEAENAILLSRKLSSNPDFIVEERMGTEEFCAQYLAADGCYSLYSFQQYFKGQGEGETLPFFTNSDRKVLSEFRAGPDGAVRKMIADIGVKDGNVMVQMIRDSAGRLRVIEIGYRMSGDFPYKAIEASTGFSVSSFMLDTALGIPHSREDLIPEMRETGEDGWCGYTLRVWRGGTIAEITGSEEIGNCPDFLVDILHSPGKELPAGAFLGRIVFPYRSPADRREKIDRINRSVHVRSTDGEDMILHFDSLRLKG